MTLLDRLWDWTCDAAQEWRSWLAHGLVALAIAVVFAAWIEPCGAAGAYIAWTFYVLREIEQTWQKRRAGVRWKALARDAFLDLWAPGVGAGLGQLAVDLLR